MECDGQQLNPLESFYGPIPPLGFCMTSFRAVWNTQNTQMGLDWMAYLWTDWPLEHLPDCANKQCERHKSAFELSPIWIQSTYTYLKQNLLIDIELRLVFEIELMENPINSSPFAVLYPYLRACRWWDMLYSDTKIQLFRHHYPQNHHQPNPYIQWLGSKIFLFRKSNLIVFLYCSKFYDGALSKTTRLFSGLTSSQASKLH